MFHYTVSIYNMFVMFHYTLSVYNMFVFAVIIYHVNLQKIHFLYKVLYDQADSQYRVFMQYYLISI